MKEKPISFTNFLLMISFLMMTSCSRFSQYLLLFDDNNTFKSYPQVAVALKLEQYGEYKFRKRQIRLPNVLDSSSPVAVLTFPRDVLGTNSTKKYPLLVFAHGFLGGSWKTYPGYKGLLDGLASFGFIVASPQSCDRGCPKYYDEVIKLVNYIDSNENAINHNVLKSVDRDLGYGILGHSMGGRATAQALDFAEENKIKAGVILHPVAHAGNITVPTAVFTGTLDQCCGLVQSQIIYKSIKSSSKAFAEMIDGLHTEPNFNTDWTAYTAAWFKVHLVGDTGGYFYDLIYGGKNTTNALCAIDSELPMVQETCEVL